MQQIAVRPATSRLAILGAPKTFAEPLHVGRPNMGDREAMLRRVNEMFDRRWFSNDGPLVREFEERIARAAGVKHCVALCNATAALEIAVRALGLGGEVILPAFTFIATAHALQWQEVTPVFADIDPVTHNLNPASIEHLITPKTTGIIGVHVWGRACDTEAIEAIGKRHGLKVIYDAAHAFGCSHLGRVIGGFGCCEVFSFHATKFLNSFEGGAIATNDESLAAQARLMRNFGFLGYDKVGSVGINGKMSEVCAAMGLTSLEAMDEIVEVNRQNYEAYAEALRGLPGIRLLQYDLAARNNYQYIPIEADPEAAPLNRDDLLAVLHGENVLVRKYFWPGCHRMEPYRSRQPEAGRSLPETERVASKILVLPTGQAINPGIIRQIVDIIRRAFEQAPEVRAALENIRR